jgi:mannosyltransferase OCH1-like enzyme
MANALRSLIARFTKIFGNSTKPISYLFYLAWPDKRFKLPRAAKPLLPLASNHRIPKILWQTNYTDRVTLAVYLNYLFNRLLSPTYEYRFMDTAQRSAFVQRSCSPEIFEAYSKLQFGAAQADLWRILILREYGGVYLDIDAHLAWPLGLTIDVEKTELYITHRGGELSNYLIASEARNPHLDLIVEAILENISRRSSDNVFELTGPRVLQRILNAQDVPTTHYAQTCFQGSFTNEFFQYLDHPQGKWCRAQDRLNVLGQ